MTIDVTKLPYDLSVIKEIKTAEALTATFPEFGAEEYKLEIPIVLPRAIELIVLLYSVGTPLILNHGKAKVTAAEYFGYKTAGENILNETINVLLNGENDEFNRMVHAYCKNQNDIKWMQLCAYWDALDIYLARFRVGGADKDKAKDLLDIIDKLSSRIDELTNEFLNRDTSPQLKQKVVSEVRRHSLHNWTPEGQAELAQLGVDIFKEEGIQPYGPEYDFKVFGNRTKMNPASDN
jgi:hypothetical protein